VREKGASRKLKSPFEQKIARRGRPVGTLVELSTFGGDKIEICCLKIERSWKRAASPVMSATSSGGGTNQTIAQLTRPGVGTFLAKAWANGIHPIPIQRLRSVFRREEDQRSPPPALTAARPRRQNVKRRSAFASFWPERLSGRSRITAKFFVPVKPHSRTCKRHWLQNQYPGRLHGHRIGNEIIQRNLNSVACIIDDSPVAASACQQNDARRQLNAAFENWSGKVEGLKSCALRTSPKL